MRKTVVIILAILTLLNSELLLAQRSSDSSYYELAPLSIQRLIIPGKAPVFTLQISGFYNVGLMDLAANDNTIFNKANFVAGRDFGTRYGYGVGFTGKIALHKKGNVRLTLSGYFNRFESNFVIPRSPEGKVAYNIFSGGLGIENNFTPDRKVKYYVGLEIVPSLINGNATLQTDTLDFKLIIKNSFRLGLSANLGMEFSFSNYFGINAGMKLVHANILLRESKKSSSIYETYLNDEKTNAIIAYAGWKQFFYATFYTGFNIYFGMKNKK
jgi:hypothetical protein